MKPANIKTRLLLVSKASLGRGLIKVASASDGIVDVAAAAELGLIARVGLVAVLAAKMRTRVSRLLQANVLYPVKPKAITLAGSHRKSIERNMVAKAMPTVIGPLYWEEQQKKCVLFSSALSRGRFSKWVKAQIEQGSSQLNIDLTRQGYADISGLVRSRQWWERCLK